VPKISVIIVNWRSKDFVRKCLLSLASSRAALDIEIIVVDGGSFDGCDEMLAKEFPDVIFCQTGANVGFGAANNHGASRATGEYVWLLNPDTEVNGEAANLLLDALQSPRCVGMVGAKLLNSDGSIQTSCVQSLPTALNQAFDSELLRRNFGLWGMAALDSQSEPVAVEAISGACMMIRRSDFSLVGQFDPRYFMYAEDMDLCCKIRRQGLCILYVPEAQVVHHGGGSSQKQPSEFTVMQMRESVFVYLKANHGILHAWFYRLCMGASSVCRIAVISVIRLIPRRNSDSLVGSIQKWKTTLNWCLKPSAGTNLRP
jgi:N-acetylglucosaminyl-diphospho-decaprenol L-rhamnosyltransferase